MEYNNEEILKISSLKLGYTSGKRTRFLHTSLDASALRGELIALIGRNGIGKSTLLRTIAGMHPSSGGTLLIDGKDVKDYQRMELALKTGYISTEMVRVGNMKVYDLVALGRFPYTNWIGKLTADDRKTINDALENCGILGFKERYINELSDGERQRAMIARVLAQDTDLMIMDEPTAFLDISSRYEIIHLLHKLAQKGKTILFSTHDLYMAINQADKIWLMLENKIIEGAPEDLLINNAFSNLIEPSVAVFDQYNGNLIINNEAKGEIFIEGEGVLRYWTERAMIRAGYTISNRKTNSFISVPPEKDGKWLLSDNNNVASFDSVYNLVSYIGRKRN